MAYAESGEFKNSIRVFEKLLKEEDDNLEILNNLGRLHKEIGVLKPQLIILRSNIFEL